MRTTTAPQTPKLPGFDPIRMQRILAKTIPNINFYPHQYSSASAKQLQAQWHTESFRSWQFHFWPYRYFLIIEREQFDPDLVPSIALAFTRGVPEHLQSRPRAQTQYTTCVLTAFRRQSDRNRWAKKCWRHIVGWSGGNFVY